MRFSVGCHVILGLFLLLQVSGGEREAAETDQLMSLQRQVEELIQKILTMIENHYRQMKTDFKCIPEEVPDQMMGVLKTYIDCLEMVGRESQGEGYLRCLGEAKTEVKAIVSRIDPALDHCPKNVTEKSYQINVTTTRTQTFHIRISNGLQVYGRAIQVWSEGPDGEKTCRDWHPGVTEQEEEERPKGSEDHGEEGEGSGILTAAQEVPEEATLEPTAPPESPQPETVPAKEMRRSSMSRLMSGFPPRFFAPLE